MRKPVLTFCVLLMGCQAVLYAAEIEKAPTTYVVDRAGVIDSATRTKLTALLQELEQKTGARIIVLTVPSTNGQDIHDWAFQRADKWKLGPNKKSASALVVIAVKDQKYWTEVGYDWQSVLTDGFVGEMGRTYFVPYFKKGAYAQGIYQGVAAIAQKAAQSKNVKLTGMPKLSARPVKSNWRMLVGFLPILFLFVIINSSRSGRRNGLFWGFMLGSMYSGRSSGGFGGGGFGGGFGGFGGGGGGGFGGGGAGGSW